MRIWIGVLLAVVVPALSGCGNDDSKPALIVSAAASLKPAFERYGDGFEAASTRFSFAGSDELAAQIEQGLEPDVYAAADTRLPERLFEQGLVEQPTAFAGNELVLATPAEDAKVGSLDDLQDAGVTLAIGQPDVPVGSYTRTVLERLPAAERDAILANVRSEEPDVAGITGKLTQGAVDAGFLYRSDVRATDGALAAIELPAELQPAVAYGVAVVKGTAHSEEAQAFVDGLLEGPGRQALADAGFEPPPAQ